MSDHDRGEVVSDEYEFVMNEIEAAFEATGGACECCGKQIAWSNSRSSGGRGAWEAHHGSRLSPVILCAGGVENCHLNCGHDGDYNNRGITPRFHRK